jgi:hypothetical protein
VDSGTSILNQAQKAAEILRNMKESLGASWADLSGILGVSESSLRVYASNGNADLMPVGVAERILSMPNPILDKARPSGKLAVFLADGKWVIEQRPNFRRCTYCGRLFIPGHPQQKYCDGYRGECGKAMRRIRRV